MGARIPRLLEVRARGARGRRTDVVETIVVPAGAEIRMSTRGGSGVCINVRAR